MADHVRRQKLDAISAVLGPGFSGTGVTLREEDPRHIPDDKLPVLTVMPIEESHEDRGAVIQQNRLLILQLTAMANDPRERDEIARLAEAAMASLTGFRLLRLKNCSFEQRVEGGRAYEAELIYHTEYIVSSDAPDVELQGV